MEDGKHRQSPVVLIRPIRGSDVPALVRLHGEFEQYLRGLDPRRKRYSASAYEARLRRDGFGRDRAFRGFLAWADGRPVGYVFYHEGYDPDEMQGRVLYVIDLFVRKSERRSGVGSRLMEAVADRCRRMAGIDVYFGVWNRNAAAVRFYRKLGARPKTDLVFHHWTRARWARRA